MTPRTRHTLVSSVAMLAVWPWPVLPQEAGDERGRARPPGAAVSDVHDALPFVLTPLPAERRPAIKGERLDGCTPTPWAFLLAQPDSTAPRLRSDPGAGWGPPGCRHDCAALCRFLV